jgi:hypothetical protein
VEAGPVRKHLVALSAAGVGLREVADIAGVSRSVLSLIKSGRRTQLRAQAARAVLRVDASVTTEATRVPAAPTWVLLHELLALGLTRGRIARMLGSKAKTPALQIGKQPLIVARTALAVERLHREVVAELRRKHEIREELRALASRLDEVAAVLELRDARRREAAREAAREKRRAS